MNAEQRYRFVDKSGHCFEDFQKMGEDEYDKRYHDMVGACGQVTEPLPPKEAYMRVYARVWALSYMGR